MIAEAKAPLFATTWWFFVSRFVHFTASVVAMVTVAGEKPVDVILTLLVTSEAGCEAPVTASASAATIAKTKVRMSEPPNWRRLQLSETPARCEKLCLLTRLLQGAAEPLTRSQRPGGRAVPSRRLPAAPPARRRRRAPSPRPRRARRPRSRPRGIDPASSRPIPRRAG